MAMVTIGGIRFIKQTYDIMQGLFIRGWSGNRVQTFMSGIGPGVRRSSVQLVRRHVLDIVKKQKIVERMASDARPTKYHLVEEEWSDPHRYLTYGSQTVFNADTGLEETTPWQIYDDNLPNKQTALNQLFEKHLLDERYASKTLLHAEVLQFKHKKGASY